MNENINSDEFENTEGPLSVKERKARQRMKDKAIKEGIY